MHSVLEVFWEIVLGITGAVALSVLTVAGAAFALGCVSIGCACTWRNWRRRRRG
jgi:hypothetical protein